MQKALDAMDTGFRAASSVGAFRGVVKNLSNSDYHGLDQYWSSSHLKRIYSTSPKHFEAEFSQEKSKPTPAMILGSLVHCLILTPEELNKEFFVMPDLDFRTKEGKIKREELFALNVGKTPISDEMLSKAHFMRDACFSHPKARGALEGGANELSYFWNCSFSGLNFKAKVDSVRPGFFLELKTTSSASPLDFARHAYNLNYDLSLAHYRQGIEKYQDVLPDAYFVVIETEAPYVVQVYKASDALFETGHAKWLSAVQKLERGFKDKVWPGYFEDTDVPELNPPAWAVNKTIGGDRGI